MNGDDYAIVVGISFYPEFDELTSPGVDALEFQKWLLSPTGGDLPPQNLTMIVSPNYAPPPPGSVDDPSVKPTLTEVDNAFRKHVIQANSKKGYRVGRRLYLFMSGHGITPGRSSTPDLDDSALLMANADLFSLGLHIPGHPYAEWFRAAGAFDEIFLFMDCCRDDASNTPPRSCPFGALQGDPNRVKRFYASATQWGLSAWEGPVGGSPMQTRSFFSFALLEALNNGIRDAQGRLTGNVLAGYIKTRLNDLRTGAGQAQDPQFLYDPQNDIVLIDQVGNLAGTVNITLSNNLTEDVRLLGSSLQLMHTNPLLSNPAASSNPWILPLVPGVYKLQSGTRFLLFEVPANTGNVDVQFI
jgi:hypothetical protein